MTYNWKQWEGQLVDGKFPLHQYLGASEHDAVFLTARPGLPSTRVAIKVIPLEFVDADRQLACWQKATSLSHRHLLRIFEYGRSQIDGTEILYVLMEYADEDLSQILPERPLTPAECTDMLQPVANALGYIHSQGLVNGHIMPSNIMASGNEVKIASEAVQFPGPPVMKSRAEFAGYDAPELTTSGLSVATDVWSLGATALEAVSQKTVFLDGDEKSDPAVPQLPEPLSSIVRNCLRVDPQQRWTIAQILEALRPTPVVSKAAPKPVAPPPVAPKPAAAPDSAQSSRVPAPPKANRRIVPLVAIGVVLAALIGYFVTRSPHSENQPAAVAATTQTADASVASAPPEHSPSPSQPATPAASPGKGEVIHRGTPSVPSFARNTIHGTVRVKVRVSVDPAGNVTATALETHGPSRYFADIARKSAADWKFSPPRVDGKNAPSEWVLKYEFRRGGTSVTPVQETP